MCIFAKQNPPLFGNWLECQSVLRRGSVVRTLATCGVLSLMRRSRIARHFCSLPLSSNFFMKSHPRRWLFLFPIDCPMLFLARAYVKGWYYPFVLFSHRRYGHNNPPTKGRFLQSKVYPVETFGDLY